MAEKVVSTCESCGARLGESAEQCNLCGWVVGSEDHDLRVKKGEDVERPIQRDEEPEESDAPEEADGIYCYSCGWKNPPIANFCSSCGVELQNVERQPVKKAKLPPTLQKQASPAIQEEKGTDQLVEEDVTEPPSKTNPLQVAMMVASGGMVVAALFFVTEFSKRAFPTTEAAPTEAQAEAASAESMEAAPLSAELEDQVATLSAEAEQLEGEEKLTKQRQIVNLLMNVQRFDRAAPVQETIAEGSGQADDWFQAGHFYYDWMDQLSGEQRFSVAGHAVSAYEQGLALTDDLNIRTALAMAYLNTQTPMLGVQNIRQVLDEEPDHLQGNFYFGVMLMQINRLDQSKAQFEKVKELVDENNPMYQQADIMLSNLETLTQ